MRFWQRRLLVCALALPLFSACDSNPVDEAIDAALDFTGIFEAADGLKLELDGDIATVVTPGSTSPYSALEQGDLFMIDMVRTGPRKFEGLGFVKTGGADKAVVTLSETSMTLNSDIPAHRTWTRTSGGATGGGGTGGSPQVPGTLHAGSSCDDWWKVLSSRAEWRITFVGYRSYEDGSQKDYTSEWSNATWSFYMKNGTRTMRSKGWGQWLVPQNYNVEAPVVLQRWDTPTNQCRLSPAPGQMQPGPVQFLRSWDGREIVTGYGTWPKAVVLQ